MRKLSPALLAATLALSLVACDPTSQSQQGPASTNTEVDYGPAARLIENLNDRLKPRSRCDIHRAHMTTGYAEDIPNDDAASCRFSNGVPLSVLIVRNGEATYEHHFGRARGPFYYLWGPTWFVIAPLSTSQEVLETLRDELGAVG
jgi:hypothetical protein